MIDKIKNNRIIISAGIYTLTSIINSAIPFLLLPILTRFLTPSDYGMISMFGILVNVISPFTGLSVHGAIGRIYYDRQKIDIQEYITNCIYILITSSVLVSICFYVFSDFISKVSSIPIRFLWIVVLLSFCQFITLIVLTLWQVEIKPIQYGFYQILQTLLNLLLSIVFIVIIGWNWEGRIYAQLITSIVFLFIGILILLKNKWLKYSVNFSYIKNALSFGIPLIPHALGGIIMTMTDRFFITNMISIEATGVYTVGYQIGMIINILATSFNQAYVPWLYSKLKDGIEETKLKVVKLTYSYFIIIIIVASCLSIIAPKFLKYFIGGGFSGYSKYIVWISLGYAFNGMYLMVTNYIFYVQKTYILAWITFFSAILNIVLNYFFINMNGAVGAAQATTIIYFINFILTWILSARVYEMPWKFFFVKINNISE